MVQKGRKYEKGRKELVASEVGSSAPRDTRSGGGGDGSEGIGDQIDEGIAEGGPLR